MVNGFTSSGVFGTLLSDPEVSAIFGSEWQVSYMLAFERAYSVALGEAGAVLPAAAEAAVQAIDGFAPDLAALAKGSERDGLPVPALVAALREDVPDEVAGAIHTGATSQDVMDTALALSLRDMFAVFEARLRGLLAELDRLDRAFGARTVMGRTRMQAALPVTVSDRLRLWSGPLQGCLNALAAQRAGLAVQFGGPVGLCDAHGDKGEAIAAVLQRELGLPWASGVWHTDRRMVVEAGHWLTLTSGALGKMGQDMALMAQQGVDELALNGAGGSSAMPHKQNPVAAELLVALARYVAGQQGILAQALVHEQERSGQAWALEWLTLPAMAEATGAALSRGLGLLGSVGRIGLD